MAMSLDAGTTVRVRRMRAEDVEPLARTLGWPTYGINRRWEESLAGHREIFVADAEGRPVGLVSINEREERAGFLHLFALDVAEPLRRRGIGTRLIGRVETEARARGLAGVYLEVGTDNVTARRLYERLGYEQDGAPFLNSWNVYDSDGSVTEEIVETVVRLVKLCNRAT
jgi:[ribosomal protein S18]-alanine N-acetyltransferase